MKTLVFKAWKDPVLSKVIASGLLLVCGSFGAWFLGLWPEIYELLLTVLELVVYEVQIPLWLIVVSVPLLIFIVPLIRLLIPEQEPRFLKYRSDNILGIDWSWGWSSPNFHNDKYSIRDLHPRCPNCKSSLELNDYSGQLVHCINDSCNWQWQQQGSFNNRISHSSELNQKVWNVIDRKIHNGEFKT
ncbi:hypothetical protein [Photobacterium alginatilyticum]|uniref:Uncharacterized protein n=1 Tax=Photobacterium alginatilyticum TaxID=1775171 RepID=A0ABW9YME4_9GAMM|nr:hypothetical protein [Photobacterium alginatilyticum]NBI54686.1 hypothetical protein [Photobacterium alginatilyticum]